MPQLRSPPASTRRCRRRRNSSAPGCGRRQGSGRTSAARGAGRNPYRKSGRRRAAATAGASLERRVSAAADALARRRGTAPAPLPARLKPVLAPTVKYHHAGGTGWIPGKKTQRCEAATRGDAHQAGLAGCRRTTARQLYGCGQIRRPCRVNHEPRHCDYDCDSHDSEVEPLHELQDHSNTPPPYPSVRLRRGLPARQVATLSSGWQPDQPWPTVIHSSSG